MEAFYDIIEQLPPGLEIEEYSKILEAVMEGITDIIGVYRPDHTLIMYNKAGYNYFKKTYKEVSGKKCYEMLGRNHPCALCTTKRALASKSLVRMEKYIPEMEKYMECSANPVFDESGEVVLIIEQLRDVTERTQFENELKRSEEKYRKLVELSPDAIVVISQGKIVMANQAAVKLSAVSESELIGTSIFDFVGSDKKETIEKRIKMDMIEQKTAEVKEHKLVLPNGTKIDVEATSTLIEYNGIPSILAVIRDITERKQELEWASRVQNKRLEMFFPLSEKAQLETLYMPAQSVSGDFYHLHKVNAQVVVGLLGDVSGKGVAAALSASAVKVLFHEAVFLQDPLDILQYINLEIVKHLGDEYVAACCFQFDFLSGKCKIAGAGINEFAYSHNGILRNIHVKGAFLGMFIDGMFEENIIHFDKDDQFYFYSDGLTDIFEKDIMNTSNNNAYQGINLVEKVKNALSQEAVLKDDCTLLAIKIK